MRRNSIVFIFIALFFALGLTVLATMQVASSPLKLTAETSQDVYHLGEAVKLTLRLKNQTEKDIVINDLFSTGDGSIKIFISKDGKNYPEYNPGWGEIDFSTIPAKAIRAHQSIDFFANVLWHRKPNALEGQSESVVNEVAKRTLLTHYAFPEAGTYFVKAVYNGSLESEPLRITMKAPKGEDLDVWNKIKEREDIAYFLYNGNAQIPDYKTEERARFQHEIEQIIEDHPSTFYAQALGASLEKLRSFEAKKEALKQTLQKPNPR